MLSVDPRYVLIFKSEVIDGPNRRTVGLSTVRRPGFIDPNLPVIKPDPDGHIKRHTLSNSFPLPIYFLIPFHNHSPIRLITS